jgi:membrane protease subunit (stomatin/prohibitin family)
MALFGNSKGEKGNVARKTFAWEDSAKGENVMYKYPRNIEWNDNVIVREDECAIFFRDGKAMHNFDHAGRYAMTTQTVPILGKLGAKLTGIKQLGEVYFVQKRELRGKFGTTEPLAFRDPDFGLVRIRAFGKFAYKVEDPMLFITKFVGTEGVTSSDKVIDWLKDEIIQNLNDSLGELKQKKNMAVVDIPAYLNEMEQIVISKVGDDVKQYGLIITNLAGLNINLPPELQEAIDKRGAMGALRVNYMQYQTGKAIEGMGKGAEKGGDASTFAGLGAGMGAGAGMGQAMSQGMQQQPPQKKVKCQKCGAELPEGLKFCSECGAKIMKTGSVPCPKCGAEIQEGSKFCNGCGYKMIVTCPKCNAELKPGSKFCNQCGAKL